MGSVPASPRSPSPYTQTSQSIPTFGTTTGMGALTPACLPPAKAGHLNRNLTHLAPRRIPSFPSHPVVIRGPTRDSTRQAKLLLTRTPSPLVHTASPIPVLRPRYFTETATDVTTLATKLGAQHCCGMEMLFAKF